MSQTVCVIIPYFQRTAGILRKALDSVARQTVSAGVRVIVIDDASPYGPEPEIAASAIDPSTVTVLRQANAGPGAARNAGLEAVPAGTEFIAFLDSDDEWLPAHLRNALDALGNDLDFYIANYREPDSIRDEFSRQGKLVFNQHTRLPRGSGCYRYEGDMADQVIVANIIETSTVVLRAAGLGGIRFRNEFRNAFEDHLFWLHAAQLSRGFAFSTNVECQYGRGVSIWRSTGLGSDRLMSSLTDQRRYYGEIAHTHAHTRELKMVVRRKLREIRHTVVADQLHRIRRRSPLDWRGLARYLVLDPALCLWALPLTVKIARGRKRE